MRIHRHPGIAAGAVLGTVLLLVTVSAGWAAQSPFGYQHGATNWWCSGTACLLFSPDENTYTGVSATGCSGAWTGWLSLEYVDSECENTPWP